MFYRNSLQVISRVFKKLSSDIESGVYEKQLNQKEEQVKQALLNSNLQKLIINKTQFKISIFLKINLQILKYAVKKEIIEIIIRL